MDERLRAKIKSVEALLKRPGTEGERQAAAAALERLQSRTKQPRAKMHNPSEVNVRRDVRSYFRVGDKVFHQRFGVGSVTMIDGNKLTIAFEVGEKRVVDSFVERL